jgi:hypothetical protein
MGRAREEVMNMAEAIKRKLVFKPDFYLATIKKEISPSDIVIFLSRSKPCKIVKDITREKGKEFAEAINRH